MKWMIFAAALLTGTMLTIRACPAPPTDPSPMRAALL